MMEAVRLEGISIHAPLRGRQFECADFKASYRFQSTPPCGGDPFFTTWKMLTIDFNPRPLAGATLCPALSHPPVAISIHAPLRGRRGSFLWGWTTRYFNPRPLAGATDPRTGLEQLSEISIHAPLRGRRYRNRKQNQNQKFQSTPPCGGDFQDR